MSKGSTARPLSVPKEQFDAAHARIFPPKPAREPYRYVPPAKDDSARSA